jgi:hypothetical protein
MRREPRAKEATTPEELDRHYSAMLDSVNLINEIVNNENEEKYRNVDIARVLKANVDHLKIMLEREEWGDRDLIVINAAIASGTAKLEEV